MKEQPKKANPTDWTDDRCDDLSLLEELLNVAGSLNSGNNIIGRIQKLEELSGKLGRTDYSPENPRLSFRDFLNNLAIKDRFGEKP